MSHQALSMPETTVIVVGGPTASGKSALALDLGGGVRRHCHQRRQHADLPRAVGSDRPPDRRRRSPRSPSAVRCPARLGAMLRRPLASHGAGGNPHRPSFEPGAHRRRRHRPLSAGVDGGAGGYSAGAGRTYGQWSRDLHAAIGSPGLHALLAERDPETAARLKPGDTQRLLRAGEVLEATGRSITAWQSDPASGPPAGLRFLPIVVDPPREALYAACDGRFDRMIELGALDEVRALMALDLPADLPVMKALGVPELSSYLAGETDLATRSRIRPAIDPPVCQTAGDVVPPPACPGAWLPCHFCAIFGKPQTCRLQYNSQNGLTLENVFIRLRRPAPG